MNDHIKKFEELFQLGEKKIISQKIKRLTAPGENYGSLMLSVDITVEGPEGTEELRTVAKLLPPNEEMQRLFQVQTTFRNEIAFYKTIVPTLRDFQRKHGVKEVIDFFPKYYGSRFNLDGGTKVDTDAVLVLENLKVQNFVNFERTEGFDLEISKLILKDLAYLHAVPIALKLQKLEVFETVKQYLASFTFDKKSLVHYKQIYNQIIHDVSELEPFLERLKKISVEDAYPGPPPREPFGTISHNDCWVNNTMIQVKNGKPVKTKIVDYQLLDYGSPAKDVLFFLFTSVQNRILEKHYDELIAFYHKIFLSVLLELHCDVEAFSFDAFLEELDIEARGTQFIHIALLLFPIFAPKGSVTDITELTPADIGKAEPTELHKEKMVFVVKEFAKRNWI